MPTDKQLLEAAIKPTKRAHHWDGDVLVLDDPYRGECSSWNPLKDDGDALRLANRLSISIHQNLVYISATAIKLTLAGIFIKEDSIYQDHDIATRYAIVRAAAALSEIP